MSTASDQTLRARKRLPGALAIHQRAESSDCASESRQTGRSGAASQREKTSPVILQLLRIQPRIQCISIEGQQAKNATAAEPDSDCRPARARAQRQTSPHVPCTVRAPICAPKSHGKAQQAARQGCQNANMTEKRNHE